MTPDVVVTGAGIASAAGLTMDDAWTACRAGRPLAVPTRFAMPGTRTGTDAFELPFCGVDHDAIREFVTERLGRGARRMTRNAAIAVYVAMQAAGGIEPALRGSARTGVFWGSGSSTIEPLQASFEQLLVEGRTKVSPMTVADSMASAPASAVAASLEIKGPAFCVGSACASSAHAIALGAQFIRLGIIDRAIVGGSEILSDTSAVLSWLSAGVVSRTECRPFQEARDGIVLGDGAAALLLESAAAAAGRPVLAVLAGESFSTGAKDIMAPDPDSILACLNGGIGVYAMRRGAAIGVNCHATGTKIGDAVELDCLRQMASETGIELLCSATKPYTGHTMSAAGAIESVLAIASLRNGCMPAAIRVGGARDTTLLPSNLARADLAAVLSVSFGFGGMNCMLAFDTPTSN